MQNHPIKITINSAPCPYPYLCTEPKVRSTLKKNECIKLTLEQSTSVVTAHVETNFSNPVIKDMLKEGTAKFVCQWICTRTNKQDQIFSQSTSFSLNIPVSCISAFIQIRTFIVATVDIPEYRNSFIGKYANLDHFYLSKGEYLAIFPSFKVNFDLMIFNTEKMGSVFKMERDTTNTEGGIRIDLSQDKLTIRVPQNTFDTLMKMGKDSPAYKATMAAYVTIAVTEGLRKMSMGLTDDNKWVRALKESLRKNNVELDMDNTDFVHTAQKILDMPLDLAVNILTGKEDNT